MDAPTPQIARVKVAPEAVPSLVAFAAAHPVPDLPATPERLLRSLVLGPRSIIDLWQDGERVLVAAVVDNCANALNVAELVVVGARGNAPSAGQVAVLLDEAERVVAAGPRRGLEIALSPVFAPHADGLGARGYAQAYEVCSMSAALDGRTDAAHAGWHDLDTAAIDAAHALLLAAFADVPGTGTPTLAEFRRSAAASPAGSRRVLEIAGDIAAYLHVIPPAAPGEAGTINVIARHPHRRGQGLGERALREAMRLLEAGGAPTARLDVVTVNPAALALYQRCGFETMRRVPVVLRLLER